MKKPIYRSFAESFRLNLYLPACGLITPPTATYRADANLARVMASSRPPQAVMMHLNGDLQLLSPAGEKIGDFYEGMLAIRGKAVPILYLDSDAAFEPLFHFADEHCLGDMTICMPYEKRALLPVIRKMLPLSRGILDLRRCILPELVELVGNIYESDATMVLLSGPIEGDFLRKLQKRFIQAWVEGDESPAAALAAGACGVICQDMNGLYDLYAMFPARSSFRPTPLYAHKAYHATGEYPENSILRARVKSGMANASHPPTGRA